MNALLTHLRYEFKTGVRDPSQLLMNYLFPLAFYVLMGLLMVPLNPTFAQTMIPAMIAFVTMVAPLLGLPSPLVEAREAGIFRSFKINGVPALSILAIPTMTTVFHVLIVSAIIALTAGPVFGAAMPVDWTAFAALTLLTACTLGALGALIAVVATDSRSVVLLSQTIFLPSMMLGGMMVPTELLPNALRPLARLLPSTYAMQAFVGLAYRRETLIAPWLCVLVLLGSAVLAFSLAALLFNWDSRNETRRAHPALALLAFVPYAVGLLLG